MNAKHLLIIGCQLLLMTVCSGTTTAQNANAQFEKAKSTGNQEDVLELARILCGMYRTKDDLEGERNIAAVQLLALNLDSVPVHEQTTLLRAIQQLIPPSAAAAYLEVDKGHAEKSITDHDWRTSMRSAVELVPEQLEESLLKSLEEWNKKLPRDFKSADPCALDLLGSRGSKFLIRAVRSTDSQIAESAFFGWCNKEREQFKSMQEVSASVLNSWNPKHRLEALDFYSQINSTWEGQLFRLYRLTMDSETSVAAKATELWTCQGNSARLQLETLATGTAVQRAGILESIDKRVVEEWGSLAPVTDLFNSPDIETRTAAVKAFGRLSESIEPAMTAFEAEGEAKVRQTILDETQFREMNESLIPRLAKAERTGLNTEKAMQKISAPYGFRPNHIYRQLTTEGSERSRIETLGLLVTLLDNDPSDEATQMAIQVLENLLTERGEDGQRLSLQNPLMNDFCSKHANRLSPIVPVLADNIESTKRRRGAEILVFFGQHAEPALPSLIRILEDDSRESQDCWKAAIHAIRAMGAKGRPAGNALLKVIAKENSPREEAAMAYLDIGCDPAPLFPAMGGYITVLAKIDPEKLVMIPGFQEYIRARMETNTPYDVLTWLGPHAEFLLPELKNKFQQLFPTSSGTTEFDRLLDVIAELGPARQELVPLCLEKLKQEPVVPHIFFTSIKTLNRIGDDQRLAYDAIKALTQSPIEYVKNAAQKSFHSLYGE